MPASPRPRIGGPLAVAVLAAVAERPMYPYEIASVLRGRAGCRSPEIKWGSLYTVVRGLDRYGLVEAVASTRQGRRPWRTVYRITEAGRAELVGRVRELVGAPERADPEFRAALAGLVALDPRELAGLLDQRRCRLAGLIAGQREWLAGGRAGAGRLALAEVEYDLAVRQAELAWIESLLADLPPRG